MAIHLYNTLSRKKELFTPQDVAKVRMYVCGPTVYDRAHLGNARAAVVFDMLYRLLRHIYGAKAVIYVRNITDVDDKIIKAASKNNESIDALCERTIALYHEDIGRLNCLVPTHEPRATRHIPEMLNIIEKLLASHHAYLAKGHVLFSVDSYSGYGRLSRRTKDEMIAGARVEVAPFKRNPADFVLWKPSPPDEQGFKSRYSYGRPGWHIECSAMSEKYLGATFDIHGGGADLMFPHHENEIAQSICAEPNSQFARYWVHNGFLTAGGDKMSKSLGNFITVADLISQGLPGYGIRLALLSSHYRKPLDYNSKLLSDALKAAKKFAAACDGIDENESSEPAGIGKERYDKFVQALCDDLNVALAFSIMHQTSDEIAVNKGSGNAELKNTLNRMAGVIGLNLDEVRKHNNPSEVPPELESLLNARLEAKQNKNYAEADKIRQRIVELGYNVSDTPGGGSSVIKIL